VANRRLIRKALAEFSRTPARAAAARAPGRYGVAGDDGATEYRFRCPRPDPRSLARRRRQHHPPPDGVELPLDALDFFIDLRETLDLSAEILPVYLQEISSTLASTAYKLGKEPVRAADLIGRFPAVETGMTEGHPCFVATTVGSGSTPTSTSPMPRRRRHPSADLAGRGSRTIPRSAAGLIWTTTGSSAASSARRWAASPPPWDLGLDLGDFHLVPVHPWQWSNTLASVRRRDRAAAPGAARRER